MPYAAGMHLAGHHPNNRKQEVKLNKCRAYGWGIPPNCETLHWLNMRMETRAVHAGRRIDPATAAVAQPIYLSSTFERTAEGEYPLGFSYSRDDNPNRRALEECLAELEGGKEALAFASGLAVASAVMQGLERGDHIILADDVYWGLR